MLVCFFMAAYYLDLGISFVGPELKEDPEVPQ